MEEALQEAHRWAHAIRFSHQLVAMQHRIHCSHVLVTVSSLRQHLGLQTEHSVYLQKLRAGTKAGIPVRTLDVHGTVHRATAESQRLVQGGAVVTAVADESELAQVAFYLQGDASLATEEKMQRRQELRYHRLVLESLQSLWEAAQRSLQSGGDTSASELHRDGHALMLRRVYRLMIRDFDDADCDRWIAEDWSHDSRGRAALCRKSFCDAFFELADTWTTGISALEYTAFKRRLPYSPTDPPTCLPTY